LINIIDGYHNIPFIIVGSNKWDHSVPKTSVCGPYAAPEDLIERKHNVPTSNEKPFFMDKHG
jgi:DNA helicase TIP49 (TBP-interacting protein)